MDSLSSRIVTLQAASRRSQRTVTLPRVSTHTRAVLTCLREQGYLRTLQDGENASVLVTLAYGMLGTHGEPAFRTIFRVSRPGRRVYLSTRALWAGTASQERSRASVATQGLFVLSTPYGVRTDREARLRSVGGEILLGIV